MALPVEWKQFPYAYQYLSKYLRSEEESKLLSRWITRFNNGMELKSTVTDAYRPKLAWEPVRHWCVHTTPVPYDLGCPETLYWEVAVSFRGSDSGVEIDFGFEPWESYIRYCNDGHIVWGVAEPMSGFEMYASGDTIGCGFTDFGDSILFTKNGRHIATVDSPSRGRTWMRLRTTICSSGPIVRTVLNFGQKAFLFNLEGHLQKIARSRELASRLPSELVRAIVELVLGDSISGIQEYRALHHMSCVSRYYRELCCTVSFRAVILSSRTEMKAAVGLNLLLRARNIILEENPSNPWFHLFQLPPSQLSGPPQRWTYTFDDLSPHCPSHCPISIRPFVPPRTWTSIRELELHRRTFKTWASFTAFVFSFAHLETLHAGDIQWEDAASVKIPPQWLRFTRRLRHISFAGDNADEVGYFWLLIAGKRTSREGMRDLVLSSNDIPIMTRIMRALATVSLRFKYIEHTSLDNGTRTLATYREDSRYPVIEVTLQPHAEQYQVVNIKIETDHNSHDGRLPNRLLHHSLSQLSSHNTLRLEIILADRNSGPEVHQYWTQQMPALHAAGRLTFGEAPQLSYFTASPEPLHPEPSSPESLSLEPLSSLYSSGEKFVAVRWGSRQIGEDI